MRTTPEYNDVYRASQNELLDLKTSRPFVTACSRENKMYIYVRAVLGCTEKSLKFRILVSAVSAGSVCVVSNKKQKCIRQR